MRQAVALFAENETRDELGLGSVRDAISNALFPGTSVIQTRLRYILFIPWLYQTLEQNRRVHAGSVAGVARAQEIALIEPLVKAGEAEGVIGRRSRGTLQRLPSSVYWLALGRWGIFEHGGSLDDYHRDWERLRSTGHPQRGADDQGVAGDRIATWTDALPPRPEDFPAEASFALTRDEAVFVQERIRATCRGSLLAHAVDAEGTARPHRDLENPWESFVTDVPARLAQDLRLARKFAALMRGAAFSYNLALARKRKKDEKVAEHEASLTEWATEAAAEGVADWSLDELWRFCAGKANVTPRTREFVATWQRLFREHGRSVGDSDEAARLVAEREWQLKGSRSRFRNARALENWKGDSGTALMTYRWRTVRQLLWDLYDGLDRKGA